MRRAVNVLSDAYSLTHSRRRYGHAAAITATRRYDQNESFLLTYVGERGIETTTQVRVPREDWAWPRTHTRQ